MIGKDGFDVSQPIMIIPFLIGFRMACNNAGVHKGAAVLLLAYFLRGTAKGSYHARLSSPKDARMYRRTEDTKITSNP